MNISFRTALPFPASIDWDRAALRFHAGRKCARTADAQWLGQWVNRSCADSLEARRGYGAAAFDAYLDVRRNPTGVAEALLREIQETRRAKASFALWSPRRNARKLKKKSRRAALAA